MAISNPTDFESKFASAPTFNEDNSPPPQYEDIAADHSSVGGFLMVKDFIPSCLEQSGIFSSPKFESFDILVAKANEWLRWQPQWEAKTCESIEFKCKRGSKAEPEKMTYLEYGESITCFIRGLRLWLVPRKDKKAQTIGFVNVIPAVLDYKALGWPTFQSLDEVLRDFNFQTRTNPELIPGRILTVETQEMKCINLKKFDANKNYWYESGDIGKHFIVVIRVFYERDSNLSEREQIGLVDFKPVMVKESGLFKHPKYEPFSNVIGAASQWCSQQNNIRYCNAQTYEVKVKSGNVIDTQRMTYMERGSSITCYLRILRVAYVTLMRDQVAPPLTLTCKNFVPYVLVLKKVSLNEYENLSTTLARVGEWLRATGAKVLSCETTAMRMYTGGERKHGVETSFTYNLADRLEHWVFVVRIFLDGIYSEPPAGVLSPPPNVADESCTLL